MPENTTTTPADFKIKWDDTGEREYETGVDRGVIYELTKDAQGKAVFTNGEGWNGLTKVGDNPTGGDITDIYANNAVYASLVAAEKYGGNIEAYMYPDLFAKCDGSREPIPGVRVRQQPRLPFGLTYRSMIVNDFSDEAYELHFIYNAKASPSSKDHSTTNETPEAATMSWEFSCTTVDVPGFKPSSTLTIRSDRVDKAKLAELENILYGTASGTNAPRLPMPAEILEMLKPDGNISTQTKSVPESSPAAG